MTIIKKLFIVFFSVLWLAPLFASADGVYIATSTGAGNAKRCYFYQGLVPCGSDVELCRVNDVNNNCGTAGIGWQGTPPSCSSGNVTTAPCTLCHSFVMFNGIVNFVLFKLAPAIGVLMLVIAGFYFFAVPQSPNSIETGKKILTTVVIGIVILLASWLFLNFFFAAMGVKSKFQIFSGQNIVIDCPITQP